MVSKASILIVDDNASLCKTMSLILNHKGYAVSIAQDGPEAIELVKEHAFDMVFMDIKMPVRGDLQEDQAGAA
ncbi:MAG: response regulator [Chloroflexi bacterium]|nr:response regulator [Chloroflexota bacterium]